jgi:SAM-dependent methyltransferase
MPARPLSAHAQTLLRCPACQSELESEPGRCTCTGAECGQVYPVLDGSPVLLHEANSVFTLADFVEQRNTFYNLKPSRASRWLDRITPQISRNVKAAENFDRFARLLLDATPNPLVLVLGGGVLGDGMERLAADPRIELVESDVSFGPRTQLICDGHDIPFPANTFDGVIVQAVLEHVVDPHRVAAEIHRVLKPDALVYAETPFMQQMHGGRYDFERFSYWGHRRLFRQFSEVDSGVTCGPGMALAWSYTHFLRSFAHGRRTRHLLNLFGSFTAFWLKYFDAYLVKQPAAIVAASGYYFVGRKSDVTLSDRDLVHTYKVAR